MTSNGATDVAEIEKLIGDVSDLSVFVVSLHCKILQYNNIAMVYGPFRKITYEYF